MTSSRGQWALAIIFVLSLAGLAALVPSHTIDPWGLINPKKLLWMFVALSGIQLFGALLSHFLGLKAGMVLTGFLAGILSSTALTISLARASQEEKNHSDTMMLSALLAGVLAVFVLSAAILFAADGDVIGHSYRLVLVPSVLTLGLIIVLWRRKRGHFPVHLPDRPIDYISVLKLTLFIALILAVSKFAQNTVGESGLMWATFLVSLFEVHGSLMASTQLLDAGRVVESLFTLLITVALTASFVSKFFILAVFGEKRFALKAATALTLIVLGLWSGFLMQP